METTRLRQLQEKLASGLPVPVRFFNMEKSYIDEFDDNFVALLTSIEHDEETGYRFFFEWADFTDHNRRIDKCQHYDKSGKPTLSFFDSPYYPKNHRTDMYIDENELQEHVAIEEDPDRFRNPPKLQISKDDLKALLKEHLDINVKLTCGQEGRSMYINSIVKVLFDGEEIASADDQDSFQIYDGE